MTVALRLLLGSSSCWLQELLPLIDSAAYQIWILFWKPGFH